MNIKPSIIEVTEKNLSEYPQVICYINPRHEHYHLKIEWLKQRFKEGLKVNLLYLESEKKPVGFIEYVPAEYCWRAVTAQGYMFIHCLWTYGKKYQHQGLGRILLEQAEKAAASMLGVAVVTSDNAFMAHKSIFLKNGYTVAAESGKDQLLVKQLRTGPPPSIRDWRAELVKYQDLTIIYSRQCPWVARFAEEIKSVLEKEKLNVAIIEIQTAAQAQAAPSVYSVFNVIHKGRLLADRYISVTRFLNIMKKELLI
ncbi:MAG: GNAT family N-acetyltransferase [Spirochaetales bacterium]|nr:GNAT family N-acetyltransferase [Spirochaetales bacterium]